MAGRGEEVEGDILVVSLLGAVHGCVQTHVHAQITIPDHQTVDCTSAALLFAGSDLPSVPVESLYTFAEPLGKIRSSLQTSPLRPFLPVDG